MKPSYNNPKYVDVLFQSHSVQKVVSELSYVAKNKPAVRVKYLPRAVFLLFSERI